MEVLGSSLRPGSHSPRAVLYEDLPGYLRPPGPLLEQQQLPGVTEVSRAYLPILDSKLPEESSG